LRGLHVHFHVRAFYCGVDGVCDGHVRCTVLPEKA
jgi:hypothetical protein